MFEQNEARKTGDIMASSTVSAATGLSSTRSHLRLVDANEVARIAQVRKLQWEALQAGHSTPIRLTKRGRRVVGLLILLPLAVVMWFSAGRGAIAAGTAPTVHTVVVQPGQSLWDLAVEANPLADPRETIFRIKQLNGFTGSELVPGQGVLVPAGN